MTINIRLLQFEDIPPIAVAFQTLGWNKPASLYERYLAEQERGQRTVFVLLVENSFAGYITIHWHSDYPPFQAETIPEIQDFNILPQYRRQGLGTRLMDQAEQKVAEQYSIVGIGVGMMADYGAAQRMYVHRGYIPDGRGLFYRGHFVTFGEQISVNDELVLYFTKRLNSLST